MGLEAADYHNDTEDEEQISPTKEEYGKTEEE